MTNRWHHHDVRLIEGLFARDNTGPWLVNHFESVNACALSNLLSKKPPNAFDFTWLKTGVKLLQNGHY